MRFLTVICLLAIGLLPVTAEAKTFNADTFKLENGLQVVVIARFVAGSGRGQRIQAMGQAARPALAAVQ